MGNWSESDINVNLKCCKPVDGGLICRVFAETMKICRNRNVNVSFSEQNRIEHPFADYSNQRPSINFTDNKGDPRN
jgi:hypothetical protein